MKRKAAQSKQSSREHTAESSPSSQNAGQTILYEEASGKTVAFVRYAAHSKGWAAFEIRFTDGTFLFIEPIPQVEFRVRLLRRDEETSRRFESMELSNSNSKSLCSSARIDEHISDFQRFGRKSPMCWRV